MVSLQGKPAGIKAGRRLPSRRHYSDAAAGLRRPRSPASSRDPARPTPKGRVPHNEPSLFVPPRVNGVGRCRTLWVGKIPRRLPQATPEGPTRRADPLAKATSDVGSGAQRARRAEPRRHTQTGEQGKPGTFPQWRAFLATPAGGISGNLRKTQCRGQGTLRDREWASKGPQIPRNAPEQGTGGHGESHEQPQRDDR